MNDTYDFSLPNFGPQSMDNSPYGNLMGNDPFDLGSYLGQFGSNNQSGGGGGGGQTPYQALTLGANIPTFQLGLQGLGTLGGLWGSYQSNKLARDSFNFQKGMAKKNLANQIKSYNTALTDRATTRGFVQGDSKEATQQYINTNKM